MIIVSGENVYPNRIEKEIIDSFGDERIIKIGWITSNRVYDYMYAADLAVFTGLHSVLWEQTVASCVPCLFSKLKGFEHVDIGGNALFFENRSIIDVNFIRNIRESELEYHFYKVLRSMGISVFVESNDVEV